MDFSHMTAAGLFGVNPGNQAPGAAPAGTPIVSHTAGDSGAVPWHPDSHAFWLLLLGAGTLLGIVGASVSVRGGPLKAGASLGKA